MGRIDNPFEELYVSETIPPREFVTLFSPFLISKVSGLFQRGNVVLRGVAGSGKSMLLSLLRPSIRLAYAEAGVSFPVPPGSVGFLSCGINLRSSNALRFGKRRIFNDIHRDESEAPLFFADYVNTWLVRDLLRTLELFRVPRARLIAEQIGLSADERVYNTFARALANDACWFGALESVQNLSELTKALDSRLTQYIAFFNFNVPDMPDGISRTKTEPGVPLATAARLLRESEVIPRSTLLFAQIDQYEEVQQVWGARNAEGASGNVQGAEATRAARFQQIVHAILGSRDDSVFYRVGVRHYAWRDDLVMHGSTASLERAREYETIDIDAVVRRQENASTSVFPSFAEDVLRRRLGHAGYAVPPAAKSTLAMMFGRREKPEDRARRYVPKDLVRDGGTGEMRGVTDLSGSWQERLQSLFRESPFDAKLAQAWARQRLPRRALDRDTPPSPEQPWKKVYWRKERREQALLQLAADYQQRPVWSGVEDVLALSGGNVLVFVSLCRHIWNAYARGTSNARHADADPTSASRIPSIEPHLQSIGIEQASIEWYGKLRELPGGSERQRFIRVVCGVFRERLLADKAMSNPGHNGFSLAVDDLEHDPSLAAFLRAAVDYGDLLERPHTTRMKDRKPRIKWYVKPVLSPFFVIPVAHTKEPIYVTTAAVNRWRAGAESAQHPDQAPAVLVRQQELEL